MGFNEIRADVTAKLRAREAEDVAAIFDRLRSEVPDHVGDANVEYLEGLRETVAAVFDYCLSAMARDEDKASPFPQAVLDQARRAARNKVSLGTVLRRCNEGGRLLREILAEETKDHPTEMHALLLRAPESALARMTATIEAEYERELRFATGAGRRRPTQIVRSLLAGKQVESADLSALGYKIHSRSHLGIVATGAGAEAALGRLKAKYHHYALVTPVGDGEVSAWLADQGAAVAADLRRLLTQEENPGVSAGAGGPYPGLEGFRRAHEEAREALSLALAAPSAVAHYGDNPLLAATLQNEPLRRRLKDFIAPLDAAQRRALRAYVNARCNATSAAAAMRVNRHTVKKHVADAEELIKRRLEACLAELDVALRLDEFEQASADATSSQYADVADRVGQIVVDRLDAPM